MTAPTDFRRGLHNVLVLAMESAILMSLCTLFYQLLKQQGRILLRLDDVEKSARLGLAPEIERPDS